MAQSSFSSRNGVVVTVPVFLFSVAAATLFLFFLSSFLYPPPPTTSTFCSCPTSSTADAASPDAVGGDRISPTVDDIDWVKRQIQVNGLRMQDNVLRKGINPRTRAQQLQDLIQYKGISHYQGAEADNHTAFPCPGELLVEEHHSNYGEPWAGGRDVYEFLADSIHLSPNSRVLEVGCGTLRVGVHFIRYLNPQHFHCLERDELSLMAALRYELPSQGLLHKRPLIVKGEGMDFSKFGDGIMYDLIYASAVFIHVPDKLVWVGFERLAGRLNPLDGRIFVSHNIKFCTRLGVDECTKRLKSIGLEHIEKHTHDSLLFNHYEIWFEFRRLL